MVGRPIAENLKSIENIDAAKTAPTDLTSFFKQIALYYSEFLATDFKRQQQPKRRVQTADRQGRRTNIRLGEFSGFEQKVWGNLIAPISGGFECSVSRGAYQSSLPKTTLSAIGAQIDTITEQQTNLVRTDALVAATTAIATYPSDVEQAYQRFTESVRVSVTARILAPFLEQLDGYLKRTAFNADEAFSDLESQLAGILTAQIDDAAGVAFSDLFVKQDPNTLEELLDDHFNVARLQAELRAFFQIFAAADLFVEISTLVQTQRLAENTEFYLQIGEAAYDNNTYPVLFMPVVLEQRERTFALSVQPILYVNKRAVDYIAQTIAHREERPAVPSVVPERILYLAPEDSVVGRAQRLFDDIALTFNLPAEINLDQPRRQSGKSANVRLTNALNLSVFDRSDESIVNDYEAILQQFELGGPLVAFFSDLLNGFLLENPVSVHVDIDNDWDALDLTNRLVYDSPLPVCEEQRKILNALRAPKTRFVAVEGPPGTGKSHTISAVAFDAIMSGKSLLVLSDKKEALDVVEAKLNGVLAKVRPEESFQNPILRLGRDGSNFNRIFKKSSLAQISQHNRLNKRTREERDSAKAGIHAELRGQLEQAADQGARISLREIAEVEAGRVALSAELSAFGLDYDDLAFGQFLSDFALVATATRDPQLLHVLHAAGGHIGALPILASLSQALLQRDAYANKLRARRPLQLSAIDAIGRATLALETVRMPVFGYAFAGKRVARVRLQVSDECGVEFGDPKADLPRLVQLRAELRDLAALLEHRGLTSYFPLAWAMIEAGLAGKAGHPIDTRLATAAERIRDHLVQVSIPTSDPSGRFFYELAESTPFFDVIRRAADLHQREEALRQAIGAVPTIDYLAAKTQLESLNSQALADQIDERLIDYANNRRNDGLALAKIIREKQKFPTEKFADMQTAFPCIIAGLRDYAECIPLKQEIFDLVVIDEASQVSIAQALTAIIRAKKVLVMGDRNQFGNVKTGNSSREINAAHFKNVKDAFATAFPTADEAVQTRIDLFDIRNSVLDFVEHVANFSIQLRKHFRSYPELISFSSQTFYRDSLQVMKIRGQTIDEVIEFAPVVHDGAIEPRNINKAEGEAVLKCVEQLLDREKTPTVGVITPHTEQQAYIGKLLMEHPRTREIFDPEGMKMKVMTFDTCQGEERKIILYSLVATQEKDKLAYVFASRLDGASEEEVDHNLRKQRLNVGLSRAEEKVIFLHSKPIKNYNSALKDALLHFNRELERGRTAPTAKDVDQSSPMEAKALQWIREAPIVKELGAACEIKAQFPIGEYLAQCDPTYRHPAYRADFLLRIREGTAIHHLVIEYDGFEHHIDRRGRPAGLINADTFETYLKPADIEREKVLESYGVRMIRLNRYNVGKDPVRAVDELIRARLNGLLTDGAPHELVQKVAEEAAEVRDGLKSGDYKHCSRCDRDLPIEQFRAHGTKSGYGRICHECKDSKPVSIQTAKPKNAGQRQYYGRRRWHR